MKPRRQYRCIEVLVIVLSSALCSVPSAAQSIALITDISGKVTGSKTMTILSEIAVDARLRLEADAKLVAIYLKSGDEYTFTGPAQVRFGIVEPQVLQGTKPQMRASPLGNGASARLKPADVTQAGYVMRGIRVTTHIKLLTLSGTQSLETSPEFRWQAVEPDLQYRFELSDDTGRSLLRSEVAANALTLPASVVLREGASYTWEVSTWSSASRRYVNVGDFRIAGPQLREEAIAMRPAIDAPVSTRVAYAAWLAQVDLHDEARKYWQALAVERPEDARLKALAIK